MEKTKKIVASRSLEIFQICCFLVPCLVFGSNALIYWCAEHHCWPLYFSTFGVPDMTYLLTGIVLAVQYFSWCWFILKLWGTLFEGTQSLPRWFCFLVILPVAGPLILMPLMLLGPALRRESPALRRCFLLILLTWIVQAGIFGLAVPVFPWISYTLRAILMLTACILLLPVSFSEFQLLAGRHVMPWCRRWVIILSVVLLAGMIYSLIVLNRSDNRMNDLEGDLPDPEFGYGYIQLNRHFSPIQQKPKQHLSQLIRVSRKLENLQEEKALWGARDISIQHQVEGEKDSDDGKDAVPEEVQLANKILANAETLQLLDKLILNGPEEETNRKKAPVMTRTEADFASDMVDVKNLFDIYSIRITDAAARHDTAAAVSLIQLEEKLLAIIAEDGFGQGPLTVYGATSIASEDIPQVLPLLQNSHKDLEAMEIMLNDCSKCVHNALAGEFSRVILRKLQLAQSSFSKISLLWEEKLHNWFSFAPEDTAVIAKMYFGPGVQQARYAAACKIFYQSAPWKKDYYELNFPQKPAEDDSMSRGARWIQPIVLLANDPEPLFRQFSTADSRVRMALTAVNIMQWSSANNGKLPVTLRDMITDKQLLVNPLNGNPYDYQANEDGSFAVRADNILLNISKPVKAEAAPAAPAAKPETPAAPDAQPQSK